MADWGRRILSSRPTWISEGKREQDGERRREGEDTCGLFFVLSWITHSMSVNCHVLKTHTQLHVALGTHKDMSRGLLPTAVGWAILEGESFCPSGARWHHHWDLGRDWSQNHPGELLLDFQKLCETGKKKCWLFKATKFWSHLSSSLRSRHPKRWPGSWVICAIKINKRTFKKERCLK